VELSEDAAVAPRAVLRAALALRSAAGDELRGRALLAAAVGSVFPGPRGGLADHVYRPQGSLLYTRGDCVTGRPQLASIRLRSNVGACSSS